MLPLTPAFNWKEYRQLSNKDLKQVLAQRGLTKSGTKATIVSRIIAYDEQQ